VKPQRIFQPKPNVWGFDFAQNFTGVVTPRLKDARVPAGTAIYLRYAEWADEERRISQLSDWAFATKLHQVDCYITKGAKHETWTPSFT